MKKQDYVIKNSKGLYYGYENRKPNQWVKDMFNAYRYTLKEAKDMCSYFPSCTPIDVQVSGEGRHV
jgi:hypothetical protein